MNIEKNIDNNGVYIALKNQFNDMLKIYYENDKLCFAMDNYRPDNCFYVTIKNDLYAPLQELFLNLRKTDNVHFISLGRVGNRFEWLGEGYGLPETQDRLVIEQNFDRFKIHITKSRLNASKKNAKVGFSLTNSNFPEIVKMFDNMFADSFKNSFIVKKKTMAVKWI